MSDFISPYEINEMFQKKFDGLDFAEPYLSGVFEDDPKNGRITIGVRTPWYDFEYFVYSKESFWGCIANVESVEDVIQQAVRHLNAAVAMQLSPDGSKAQRFDIFKYQADHEGYINNNGESEATIYVDHDNSLGISDEALIAAKDITFLCTCKSCKKKFYEIRAIRIENQRESKLKQPYNGRDFDVHVHHNSKWSDQALMEAESVHFLCNCKSCMDLMNRVHEARAKGGGL